MPSIPEVPDAAAVLLSDLLTLLGGLPPWLAALVGPVGEGLLLLVVAVWLVLWSGPGRTHPATVLAVPLGGGLAWAASETAKQMFRVDRPCRLLPSFPAWAECPEPGDWSFPSNHATVAAALTVGVAVLAWRAGRTVVPAAVLLAGTGAALSRVAAGAHFPHDVLAGVLLGGIVAVVTLLVTGRLAPRVRARWRRGRRPGAVAGRRGGAAR